MPGKLTLGQLVHVGVGVTFMEGLRE